MTAAVLKKRLEDLEKTVGELKSQMVEMAQSPKPSFWSLAGKYANDPVFDEICRLGAKYRKSLRPKPKGSRRARTRH